jgi:predicted ribosome quality control (RQC) complex YloA/Tae2 family protein
MYFDALTTAAIAAELRAELLDGRVQQVLLPDRLSLAMEIYAHRQRRYLLASAHPQAARVHLLAEKPRRGVDSASPLLLLLRKYVRGARLVDIIQPPAERILHLTFDGPLEPVTLVIEVIGRYSNLVLVGADGAVLDAIKRVGPDINRYRVVLPSHAYGPQVPLGLRPFGRHWSEASPGSVPWPHGRLPFGRWATWMPRSRRSNASRLCLKLAAH